MRPVAFILFVASTLAAVPAHAETIRLAIVVGNNQGVSPADALRFAESDASKVARVFTELGGVSASDLYLLQGRPSSALTSAVARVKERIADIHQHPGNRAMLLFYFSGHSDGIALELGQDRFPFSQLRGTLTNTGADVRLAIVDSCRSGALLAAKSGRLGEPFDIRLSDDLPTEGMVLLSSSAATEQALESGELRGSFFTHNLVSGLRGAADTSGDGRVTLSEAYRYAYLRTVAATSQTIVGAQHPAYDIKLSGMGELVLTELSRPLSMLELPPGFDRAIVAEPFRDEVLAEVPRGAPGKLAVPPGDYVLRLWRNGKLFAGRALVKTESTRRIAWSELAAGPTLAYSGVKGGDASGDLATADLANAIASFEHLDDERARAQLEELLKRNPPPSIEAKARLYLGLVALNALRPDETRKQFKLAVSADPTVELPPNSSPKAQLVFVEAQAMRRRELQLGLALPTLDNTPPPPGPAAPMVGPSAGSVSASAGPPSEGSTTGRRVLSIALAVVGAAAIGAAIYGAVNLQQFKSAATNTSGSMTQPQLDSARSAALFWADAWIPLAIGGAGAATGAVLVW